MRPTPLLLLVLALPALASDERSPTVPPRGAMEGFFLLQGLTRLAAHDPGGIGSEAREAEAWARGRAALTMVPVTGGRALSDGSEERPLSAELADALRRLGDYMRASTATRLRPIPSAELRAAALRPATVLAIRSAFDRALEGAIALDGEPVVPELGGDAVLTEKALELREFRDPTREALRAVAAAQDDPAALAELVAHGSESFALLDDDGQLEREVALFAERAERGVPLERRRKPLAMAIDTVLRNGSDTFTMHPREQLECVLAHEWADGRLVGLWHLHPPGWSEPGLVAAAPPSPDDRQIARVGGQFLTIVFRPDGFDLHDLQTAPLGPAPPETAERVVQYRSEDWRAHFAAAHARLKARLTTSPSR